MPKPSKFFTVRSPKTSVATQLTIETLAPKSAAITAWFAPLPPKPMLNERPQMVSPGVGNLSR